MDKEEFYVYYNIGDELLINEWKESLLTKGIARVEDINSLVRVFTKDYNLSFNIDTNVLVLETVTIYPQLLKLIKEHVPHGVAVKWSPK